jgi:hypothetical protein
MKKSISFLIIPLLLADCKKQEQSSVADTPPNSVEKAITGKWILRKNEAYAGNIEIRYTNFYDNGSEYYLDLQNPERYPLKCIFTVSLPPYEKTWRVDVSSNPNKLLFNNDSFQIIYYSQDSLVLRDVDQYPLGPPDFPNFKPGSHLLIFNKKSFAPSMSVTEKLISRKWSFYQTDHLDTNGNIISTTTYPGSSQNTITLGTNWDSQGWSCTADSASPLQGVTNWELLNHDSLISFSPIPLFYFFGLGSNPPLSSIPYYVFKVEQLSTNEIVFNTYRPGVGGYRHYLR